MDTQEAAALVLASSSPLSLPGGGCPQEWWCTVDGGSLCFTAQTVDKGPALAEINRMIICHQQLEPCTSWPGGAPNSHSLVLNLQQGGKQQTVERTAAKWRLTRRRAARNLPPQTHEHCVCVLTFRTAFTSCFQHRLHYKQHHSSLLMNLDFTRAKLLAFPGKCLQGFFPHLDTEDVQVVIWLYRAVQKARISLVRFADRC